MGDFRKKGQVSIFVIVAIVIVAGILVFFAVRNGLFASSISAEFRPIYNLYDECIKQETEMALNILGTQGGRIDVGEFVPGSDYAPFSSHLNFLGVPVPYWYYISGNNIIKESVPSRNDMEREAEEFIAESLNENCDFTEFYAQGFSIELDEPNVNVDIKELEVVTEVRANIVVSKEDRSAIKNKHEAIVGSKLGKFHVLAREIYDKQSEDAFLEEYSIDVLRLYAPVDGVAVQCSPKIWKTREIVDELQNGLEANIAAIKFDGSYYRLNDEADKYFVVDSGSKVDENINLLYSKNWPSKIEVTPASNELMIAEPVGNQEGLGLMGFCYAPYHFVYDVSFPVMIQINDGTEIFQYPVVVVIDNNVPRETELSFTGEEDGFDACEFMEGEATIYTFDNNLNPVEADVSYKCFDSICGLGKTEVSGNGAVLNAKIPVCLNGQLIVKADGYADKKQLFSSNSEAVADVVLDREYEVEVELKIDGKSLGDEQGAIITLIGTDKTTNIVLPDNNEVKLSEGSYDVSVQAYGNSGITIPASSKTQCTKVAQGGVLGFFGGTEEQCFEIDIPEVNVESALIGGGKTTTYILESELQEGRAIVNVQGLPSPNSLEQLQYNYELFDSLEVYLTFV